MKPRIALGDFGPINRQERHDFWTARYLERRRRERRISEMAFAAFAVAMAAAAIFGLIAQVHP